MEKRIECSRVAYCRYWTGTAGDALVLDGRCKGYKHEGDDYILLEDFRVDAGGFIELLD